MHDHPINAEADRAYAKLRQCKAQCDRYRGALEKAEAHLAEADVNHDREQGAWEEDNWRTAWTIIKVALDAS